MGKKWILTSVVLLTLFAALPARATHRGVDKDIGLMLQLQGDDPAQAAEFNKAFTAEFKEAYGNRVVEIKTADDSFDELLYQAGVARLDHVIAIKGNGTLKILSEKKDTVKFSYSFSGKIRIIDASTLRPLPDYEVQIQGEQKLEDLTKPPREAAWGGVSKALITKMTTFYNPNVMGKLSLKDAADYFYQKNDCVRSSPLYDPAIKLETRFDIQAEMVKRRDKCKRTANTQSRLQAGYRCDLTFTNVGPQHQEAYKKAFVSLRMSEVFHQYSSKPVSIEVRFIGEAEGGAPGEILLTMFHDSRLFPIDAGLRANPSTQAIDFSKYRAPLSHLVRFHLTALKGIPAVHQKTFSRFALGVRLEKPNSDYLAYQLTLDRNNEPIAPKKINLAVTGYKPTEIEPPNTSLSSVYLFPLGPAVNIDGKETVYNIVYKFFDIPGH